MATRRVFCVLPRRNAVTPEVRHRIINNQPHDFGGRTFVPLCHMCHFLLPPSAFWLLLLLPPFLPPSASNRLAVRSLSNP